MSVVFRLLGPVTVGSGTPAPLRVPKLRSVLATLLLEANEVVSLDRLSMEVWGQEPPRSAIANLRSYAHALRGEFARVGLAPDRLVTVSGGYLLRVEPGERDLDVWGQLVAEARAARQRDDHAGAAGLLARALDEWHGRALEDVPVGAMLAAQAASLDDDRLAVIEEEVAARLAAGEHATLVPRLRAHLAEHPTREAGYALMMRALYRTGDVAGALGVYPQARTALLAELGIEPGAELRRLQAAILRRDPSLDQGVRSETVAPRQLPAGPRAFVGRNEEFAALLASDLPVRVIHGPAGVGKSALAIRLAHALADQYPDGQLYLDLQGSSPRLTPLSPPEVLGRFLRALGVRDSQVPRDGEEAAARYRSILAGRRMLVVLDNAVDAAQVRPLLPGTPDSAVLITSRRSLSTLDGAHQLALDVLAEGDATMLLAEVVGVGRLRGQHQAMKRIAELCERLPLALRIAGARLTARPDWSLADLADRLADEHRRLDELDVDDLAVRSCFEASYRSLDPIAARTFQMAGLLRVPDLGAPAMAAMLDESLTTAAAALDRLVEARLVEPAGADRYRLHDLLRLYAAERAAEQPPAEREAAVYRALVYYLGTCRRAVYLLHHIERPIDPALVGPYGTDLVSLATQSDATQWLDAELRCVLAVADHATETSGPGSRYPAQLIRSILHYLDRQSQWHEAERLARIALAARRPDDQMSQAIALTTLGQVNGRAGRFAAGRALIRQALELRRQLDDLDGLATTWNAAGVIARQSGDLEGALVCLDESIAALRRVGNQRLEALALSNLAEAHAELGQHAKAIGCLNRCLRMERLRGSELQDGVVLSQIGRINADRGDYPRALKYLARSLAACRNLDDRVSEGHSLLCRSEVYLRLFRPDLAITDARQAQARCMEIGYGYGQAAALRQIGKALAAQGLLEESRHYLEQAQSVFARLNPSHLRALEKFLHRDDPALPAPRSAYVEPERPSVWPVRSRSMPPSHEPMLCEKVSH